ncbi:MAG TPA: hypothetical protein VM681_09155 [Candidatus Thermoplasmatota archaeon]|nr:hypothetical protein [Candidatus Thermoplasmatota archaeon]
MRGHWRLAFALCVLVLPGVAQAASDDFEADAEGTRGTVQGEGPQWVRLDADTAILNVSAERTVYGRIRFAGTFDVERPRQVVPTVGGSIPNEYSSPALEEAAGDHALFNLTGRAQDDGFLVEFRVRLPAGNHSLAFRRDVAPPRIVFLPPENVTYAGALISTTTDEHALCNLEILRESAPEPVPYPTTEPARFQNYPVIGLRPKTNYTYWATCHDFSGNAARSPTFSLATPERTFVPGPVLETYEPANGSVVPVTARVRVTLSTPVGAVETGHVRLFVDRQEVTDRLAFSEGAFSYAPAGGFAPGNHTVLLEARNSEGGTLSFQWRFVVVTPPARAPALEPVGVLFAFGVAIAAARRP